MAQYINKDALVAEIERRINRLEAQHADIVEGYAGEISGLKRLLSFLDTLEVKEVELNDEICKDLNDNGTCMYIANKIGKVMRCEYINCCRKIKAQKGE